MKRNHKFIQTSTLLFACTLLLSLTSCLDAGDESIILEEEQEDFFGGTSNYINFDGQTATYNPGNMPSATSDTDLGDVIMNTQALAGGASFITIKSSEDYDAFYVGLAGHKGYYIVEPKSKTYNNATDKYTYTMVMNFSENYNETVNVIIAGIKKETGEVSQPHEGEVVFVESRTGDLDIKLVFENAKDIDLHLYTPSGEHIYYGNRGGSYTDAQGVSHTYGLDHDSNAGCNIDNLNNENIYIPNEVLEAGTYTVKVNMYSNCNSSISTAWSVWVRYAGELINNEQVGYGNPAEGVYPVGAGKGDYTAVFQFTITQGQATASRMRAASKLNYKPIPLTAMDIIKLEQEAIDASL